MIDQVIPIKIFKEDEEKKTNLRRDFRLDHIINKMNTHPKLGTFFDLKQGTKPYGDKENKNIELLAKEQKNSNWEPAINGRNISQFNISFENDYVLRSDKLHSVLPESIVNGPKIYFQRMRKISLFPRIVAAYDNSNIHGLYTCSVIYPKKNILIDLKYVLAIINSHLINIWYKNYDTDIENKLTSVKNIPLPEVDEQLAHEFSEITDKIIEAKKQNNDSSKLILEMNKMVYKLFDLSESDIKVIEAS